MDKFEKFVLFQILFARVIGRLSIFMITFCFVTWAMNRFSIQDFWFVEWNAARRSDLITSLVLAPLSVIIGAYWKSYLPEEPEETETNK